MKSLLLAVVIALSYIAGSQAAGNVHPAAANRKANEMVFDRNKGAIFALYVREFRDQPRPDGKITFEIDIDAAGMPTRCRVTSSQLHAPGFESKLCERIKQFRFAPQTPTTFFKELSFVNAA
jgi:hypothetical protein